MNSLYFFGLMFLVLLPVRRIGWFLSRTFLYTAPIVIAELINLIWAGIIAWLLWLSINYLHPNIILQIISYGEGMYLSNAAYGLIAENTIPASEMNRHYLLKGTAYLCFIAVIIILSFVI